jgi:hypothetical protein
MIRPFLLHPATMRALRMSDSVVGRTDLKGQTGEKFQERSSVRRFDASNS